MVVQGISLVFAREMNELSFGQNQRPAQIGALGMRGGSEWAASIFATFEITQKRVVRVCLVQGS